MKRRKTVLETTTDSRTYKMTMRSQILGCPICGPNSGCNWRGKRKQRNWKKFRKTKYKMKHDKL